MTDLPQDALRYEPTVTSDVNGLVGTYAAMKPMASGAYVRFEDFAALRQRCEEAESELSRVEVSAARHAASADQYRGLTIASIARAEQAERRLEWIAANAEVRWPAPDGRDYVYWCGAGYMGRPLTERIDAAIAANTNGGQDHG